MLRIIIGLAIAFFVAGVLIPDATAQVHSYDLTPVFGVVAITVFLAWMSKRG